MNILNRKLRYLLIKTAYISVYFSREEPLCPNLNVTVTPYVAMLGKGQVRMQVLDRLQFSIY